MNAPWKKPGGGNPPSSGGGGQPWMKGPPTQGQPPPFGKPPTGPPQSTDPSAPQQGKGPGPWKPGPPGTGGGQPWNKGGSKPPQATSQVPPQNQQKAKEEQMLKLKKQQEQQQQKKKKQQQQKKKKQQQQKKLKKQQQNQQRERKMMQKQEDHSKKREQQDKLKKPSKKSKLKKPIPKTSLKALKNKLLLIKSSFQKYLLTLDLACSRQGQYRQKKQYQKQFIQTLCKFTQSAKQSIIKYMSQRKITPRKRNFINLQQLMIQYALVQGVNDTQGNTYFKTKNIQQLQQKFSYYQIMFNLIIKLIKKSPIFHLRVPLMCRVSYKGVQFLCEAISNQLIDLVPAASENYLQIQAQLTQLQKQLTDVGYPYLHRKTFFVRKIILNNTEFYILYLIDNICNFADSQDTCQYPLNPLTFPPNSPLTFDTLINLTIVASHSLIITYSVMNNFEQVTRNITDRFKQSYLNLFPLAHAIRIVYASCQGEVEEQPFWGLVFQNNSQIFDMVKKAYESVYGEIKEDQCQLKNKFILSKILELMIPITFGIGKFKSTSAQSHASSNSQKYKEADEFKKVPIKIANSAHIISYPLDSLQFYQITQLFDKYIQNPLKFKTAQESHALQQQFIKMSENNYLKKIVVFVNKAKLLFKKGSFRESIQLVEGYEFEKGKQMQKCIIYPLLITFYIVAIECSGSQVPQPQQKKKNQKKGTENKEKQKEGNINKTQPKVQVPSTDTASKTQKPQIKATEETKTEVKPAQKQPQKEKEKEKQKTNEKEKQKSNEKVDQKKKQQQQKQKQKQRQKDYETKMLKTFNNLLTYLSQLFEDEQQIWLHSFLYTLLATYYSKIKTSQNIQKIQQTKLQNNRQSSQIDLKKQIQKSKTTLFSNSYAFGNLNQSTDKIFKDNSIFSKSQVIDYNAPQLQVQYRQKHPYHQVCMKFLQASDKISLQFYGPQSFNMADFLVHQAEIFYNIYEYTKSENSIHEAMKIYKYSSKNAKNVQKCSVILGKSMIQLGKINKNNRIIQQGVDILQNAAQQFLNLGVSTQAIQIFQSLCTNLQQIYKLTPKSHPFRQKKQKQSYQSANKSIKLEQYLQKMIQISFNCKNLLSLKQVIKQFIKSQLNCYSKQKFDILKDLHNDYIKQQIADNQDQGDKQTRLSGLILQLEQQRQNFSGFLDMIRWSLGISKSKNDHAEWGRASGILTKIVGLFDQRQIKSILSI